MVSLRCPAAAPMAAMLVTRQHLAPDALPPDSNTEVVLAPRKQSGAVHFFLFVLSRLSLAVPLLGLPPMLFSCPIRLCLTICALGMTCEALAHALTLGVVPALIADDLAGCAIV